LLLELKKKIGKKANIRMEIMQDHLYLSCCVFSSYEKMISLPLQHYIKKKQFFNEIYEPFFHIINNKIYLLQKIPLSQVASLRQTYEDFSVKVDKYNKILNDFSDQTNSFSFP